MADVRVTTLGGKPLLYDRKVNGHYGVTGVPFRPFMQQRFATESDACFTELFALFQAKGMPDVSHILSGGVGRSGTGTSLHHRNRAFDLDGLVMDGGNWVADTFPQQPLIYLAIESILRRHFGTVLNYDYNSAHEDHFHFDNGRTPGFRNLAKSNVTYIQNVLVFVYDIRVGRDGVWGPETDGAVRTLRRRLGIGPFSNTDNYMAFLQGAAGEALDLHLGIPVTPAGPVIVGSGAR